MHVNKKMKHQRNKKKLKDNFNPAWFQKFGYQRLNKHSGKMQEFDGEAIKIEE